ncbi:hypothetical protein Pcinc_043493 [Petrolisthes cinctipes]|uniref:Transposase n=1 Tax=Petrolisthes cinctipes TaxID=88211 RepID=A0AAE1EG75_PETCI|nr:hypothetical protein Pcinc_043493 [Petrolisthes cinctipes]
MVSLYSVELTAHRLTPFRPGLPPSPFLPRLPLPGDACHSIGEIARHLGISPLTAARWIRRFADSGNTTDKPRCGRPRCTTPDQDLAIIGANDADPFTPTTSILSAYDISCSTQTIRNRLHAIGVEGRKPARKPELTERVMEQRMEYALEYSDKD